MGKEQTLQQISADASNDDTIHNIEDNEVSTEDNVDIETKPPVDVMEDEADILNEMMKPKEKDDVDATSPPVMDIFIGGCPTGSVRVNGVCVQQERHTTTEEMGKQATQQKALADEPNDDIIQNVEENGGSPNEDVEEIEEVVEEEESIEVPMDENSVLDDLNKPAGDDEDETDDSPPALSPNFTGGCATGYKRVNGACVPQELILD